MRQYIDDYFKTQSSDTQQKIVNLVKALTIDDIKNNITLFNELVPPQGKADTLAGEILRALHRVGYRYYSAGEHYFEGEGIKTCGSSAIFLVKHTNQVIANFVQETAPINYIAAGTKFEQSFETIIRLVTLLMTKTPQMFFTRNTVDSTQDYTVAAQEAFEEYDSMLNDREDAENEEI